MTHRPWWLGLVLVGSLTAVGAAPFAQSEALERNRRLLEKWRADPNHSQRLQNDLRAFYALPEDRQRRLRELDQYLHQGDETAQARRWAVVDRYKHWLEALPEAERRRVLEAAAPAARLALVRDLREKQWVQRLPAGLRQRLDQLPAEQRAARLRALREEEKWQRREWQGLGPGGVYLRPSALRQFPVEVQEFVKRDLEPRLNEKEKEDLRVAEGKWPDLANTIHRLAERHPIYPPLPRGPVVTMRELPSEVRAGLPRKKGKDKFDKGKGKGKGQMDIPKEVRQANNRWPDYALAIARWYREVHKAPLPVPLGASRPGELPEEAQVFVKARLMPRLAARQREELRRLEGRWPEYPRRLHDLARQYGLVIPRMSLPGSPDLWARARAAAWAEVPGHVLWQFARKELGPRDWATLGLLPHDTAGNLEKVKGEYLRRRKPPRDRGGPGKAYLGNAP